MQRNKMDTLMTLGLVSYFTMARVKCVKRLIRYEI